MNSLVLKFILLISLVFLTSHIDAMKAISADNKSMVICPGLSANSSEVVNLAVIFSNPECKVQTIADIDPQNNDLWIKTSISIPENAFQQQSPLGLFIFAKSSSEVYFNNVLLGQNGTPNPQAKNEYAGKMDVVFYLPPVLIKDNNEIIIHFSSHHGFLKLHNPIHFIGIGNYAEPKLYLQESLLTSMIILGALLLASLYFIALLITSEQKKNYSFLLLMALFSSGQLFAEVTRSIFNYDYPLHDLRLVTILLLSFGFGFCLLAYISNKFAAEHSWRWLGLCVLLTIISTFSIESYDLKTAITTLIPTSLSTLVILLLTIKNRTKEMFGYLTVFSLFTLTIIFTLAFFHSIIYYQIITALLCYLIIKQAQELSSEQKNRLLEQQRVSTLKFRIEQIEQQHSPKKIKISSAGKIELISTEHICYCKAAGDYVELHLEDNRELLYSGSLKSIETLLPTTFLRVHRSYIVNLDFVSKLETNTGMLLLSNVLSVPVSRRIMPTVRDIVNQT